MPNFNVTLVEKLQNPNITSDFINSKFFYLNIFVNRYYEKR